MELGVPIFLGEVPKLLSKRPGSKPRSSNLSVQPDCGEQKYHQSRGGLAHLNLFRHYPLLLESDVTDKAAT